MKTALIDYGAGNIRSVKKALDSLGIDSVLTDNPTVIKGCGSIILPGVGAFGEAKKRLDEKGLTFTLKNQAQSGKPLLGICLGMQLLFDESFEFGRTEGLSLIPGHIDKIPQTEIDGKKLKIPHMGWNSLDINIKTPLLNGIDDGTYFYFVHSYMAVSDSEFVSAYSGYGVKIPALVFKDNVYGTQFHPEKSGEAGLRLLNNFFKECSKC